jgi:hypothetical protein
MPMGKNPGVSEMSEQRIMIYLGHMVLGRD